MKRLHFFLSSVIAATLVFAGVGQQPTQAQGNISVQVDGSMVQFPDAKPFIDPSSSRTLVPLRFISEQLGADVQWDQASQTVHIKKEGKSISLKIGEDRVTIDNSRYVIDTPVVIKDDRTFVPLRFIGRSFEALVRWDGQKRLVSIITNPVAIDISGKDIPVKEDDQRFQQFHQSLQIKNGVLTGKVPMDAPYIRVNVMAYYKDGKQHIIRPGESFSINVMDLKVLGITISDQEKQVRLAAYNYRDLPDLIPEQRG